MLFTFSWMLSSEIKNTWWWLHHRQILNQCLTAHHCSDFKCMQYQRPWGRTGVGQHPQLTLGMRCCLQPARAPHHPCTAGWALGTWAETSATCTHLPVPPASCWSQAHHTHCSQSLEHPCFHPDCWWLLEVFPCVQKRSFAVISGTHLPSPSSTVFPPPSKFFYSKAGILTCQNFLLTLSSFSVYILSYLAFHQAASCRMQWLGKDQEPEIHLCVFMQTLPAVSVHTQGLGHKFKSVYRKGLGKNKKLKEKNARKSVYGKRFRIPPNMGGSGKILNISKLPKQAEVVDSGVVLLLSVLLPSLWILFTVLTVKVKIGAGKICKLTKHPSV